MSGPQTPGRRRPPVGVWLALALVVIIAAGVLLFTAANHSGTPASGPTTGGAVAGGFAW